MGVLRDACVRLRYVFGSGRHTLFGTSSQPRSARLLLQVAYWSPSARVRRRLLRAVWALTIPVDLLAESLAFQRAPAAGHHQPGRPRQFRVASPSINQQCADFEGALWTVRGRRRRRVSEPGRCTITVKTTETDIRLFARRRRHRADAYPSIGWRLDTDNPDRHLARFSVSVPTGAGGNSTGGVTAAVPLKLFDLDIGESDTSLTTDGTASITTTRGDPATLEVTVAPVDSPPVRRWLRTATLEVTFDRWEPPWQEVHIDYTSGHEPGQSALGASFRLMMLPAGLSRTQAQSGSNRRRFHADWLPAGFSVQVLPGSSPLGYRTAACHWISKDGNSSVELYDSVVSNGGGYMPEPATSDSGVYLRRLPAAAGGPIVTVTHESSRLDRVALVGYNIDDETLTRIAASLRVT